MSSCFHCGLDVPQEPTVLQAETPSGLKDVCCLGCKGVTEHIYGNGLGSYYEFRSELASRPDDEALSDNDYSMYNQPEYVSLIATKLDDTRYEITLSLDNIHCAACAWLIEQSISPMQGIDKINVNTVNQRGVISWDHKEIRLGQIFARLNSIGYPATPFKVSDTEKIIKTKEKEYVKRLGVAGLFTMQVMMIAVAMYFGAFSNMEAHQIGYFKWVSLALSIPVIFYSALPFLYGAFASVRAKKLNMDVPVTVAIYGAFTASFYQLVTTDLTDPKGEVFFESISMFTFLLLIGKYLEFRAKSKAVLSNVNLTSTLPLTATKLVDSEEQQVLVIDIEVGDSVFVKAGQQIPTDGIITKGETQVSESLLTGEFEPVFKSVGDNVLAGSVNTDGLIELRVTATGNQTALADINKMQQSFSDFKPKYSLLADKIAHWFVLCQLIISIGTYTAWYFVSPDDALWVSLAVLVATCPCALSLATPTAYTCVLSTLSKNGILIKDSEAFDRINTVTTVAFDKTGTLTNGQFSLVKSRYHDANCHKIKLAHTQLFEYVSAIERQSEHPIARAFVATQPSSHLRVKQINALIESIDVQVGSGIIAVTDIGIIKIGSARFIQAPYSGANVYVSVNGLLVAEYWLEDSVKVDAKGLLTHLARVGKQTLMLTGDKSDSAERVATELQINNYKTGCKPEDKANTIAQLQSKGESVMMLGDGINDAPVFAASDVSIAMGSGADITKQSADIIVVKDKIGAIESVLNYAAKTQRIIKQNLLWALVYNTTILPVAMLGLVPPYVAVIGMSASSIIVVSNSLRLLK